MARLAYTPVVWKPEDSASQEIDLCSYRVLGLYVPAPPDQAFPSATGLLVSSRPFGEYDGEPFGPVTVGTHDGPFVWPLDPSRGRTYEAPPWADVLGIVEITMVDSAVTPLRARQDWRMFLLVDAR